MNKVVLFLVLIMGAWAIKSMFFSNFKPTLYNGDKWANYRLGDVFLISKNNRMYSPKYFDNILYHKTEYPGTIANEYINKNTTEGKNVQLIQQIIESKTKDTYNYPDTLFLHIRVGDVICVKDNEWINQVNGPLYYSKVGDTDWWNGVLDYIAKNKITKVVIVSGSHKSECLGESMSYLDDRKEFLEKNGLHVVYRLGQSPDEDLIMCYYVKHFITTGGGYGNMIKEIKRK